MSFFSRKPKDSIVLVFDIQSSLVRGSLIIMHPEKAPEIIFVHEKNLPYRQNAGSSYLVKLALRAVEEISIAASRFLHEHARIENIPRRVSAVHYALSSPWIVSQAKTVTMNFPKATVITEALIMDLVAKQRAELAMEPDDRIATVEEKVFDVRLNGYSVAAWKDKEAKEIGVSFVTSVAGTAMLDRFRQAASNLIKESRIQFHSALLLQTLGIRAIMPDSAAYTLIHIHGELTDVVVVEHSACIFFGSYPMGVRTAVRKISKAAKTDLQTADSLLTLHVAGHLDPSHDRSSERIIEDVSKGWTSEFDRLFKGSANKAAPKSNQVIMFSRTHEAFFVKSFSASHPGAHVMPLAVESLTAHVGYRPKIERLRVTGLYAVALHSIH